jgi:hypothetical protein
VNGIEQWTELGLRLYVRVGYVAGQLLKHSGRFTYDYRHPVDLDSNDMKFRSFSQYTINIVKGSQWRMSTE